MLDVKWCDIESTTRGGKIKKKENSIKAIETNKPGKSESRRTVTLPGDYVYIE